MISAWVGSAPPESDIPVVGAGIVFHVRALMMGSYARHPYNAKCDYCNGSMVILMLGHLSQAPEVC